MTKKPSLAADDELFAAAHRFAQQALADGCRPGELSRALTTIAVRVGLDLAPNAAIALAVVIRAISDAATEGVLLQNSDGADVESVAKHFETTVH
jgi:hypothetical protein